MCNCVECVGYQYEPTDAEAEAVRRFDVGEKPGYSTGVCGTLTCGYGRLDENGYWEFPLNPRLPSNVEHDRRPQGVRVDGPVGPLEK